MKKIFFKKTERKEKQKKGFTLSEVCVVLAVVGIVSAIVTSFCIVMHHRSVMSRARLDIINEVNVLEEYVESWVDKVVASNATIGQVENGTVNATVADATYEASFSNGKFTGTLPDSLEMTFDTTRIEALTFDVDVKGSDAIIFCKVTARMPKADGGSELESYTFCVNSRLDDGGKVVSG